MLQHWRERQARAAGRAALTAQLKARIRTAFGLGEDDAVAVNEIACPDLETVILIMRVGRKTQAVKIPDPMDQVSEAALAAAAADGLSG